MMIVTLIHAHGKHSWYSSSMPLWKCPQCCFEQICITYMQQYSAFGQRPIPFVSNRHHLLNPHPPLSCGWHDMWTASNNNAFMRILNTNDNDDAHGVVLWVEWLLLTPRLYNSMTWTFTKHLNLINWVASLWEIPQFCVYHSVIRTMY